MTDVLDLDDNSIIKKWFMSPHLRGFTRSVQRSRVHKHQCQCFCGLQAFIKQEKEIEDTLPQFQELILSLRYALLSFFSARNHYSLYRIHSNDDQPTKEASAARKRLLEAFAQYDALAKRIRKIPCPEGKGSSQDRVQAAIVMRANLFLQKNMFPLQVTVFECFRFK